jgi:SAM-dependent methyltransferase
MSFNVGADSYNAFMGRYSEPLAAEFMAGLNVHRGQRALDVGCGPGAMTARLTEVLGPDSVCAVDPSASFVAAARTRLPEVDVQQASAERMPFKNDEFDLSLAQLVVHFMADPDAGIGEMARVTRPDGLVSASVWDHAGGRGPLSVFWRAVRDLDSAARDESELPGARDGHLVELFNRAGLHHVTQTALTVHATFSDFDQWWNPFTLGVGPAGAYLAALDPDHRESLRARCTALVPAGPFTVSASAWTAHGRA